MDNVLFKLLPSNHNFKLKIAPKLDPDFRGRCAP